MVDLKTLPEPEFITVDWNQQYAEIVKSYEQIVGIPLSKGQVESLMIATFAYRENLLRIAINDTAKQNLLAYARGGMLDHLGVLLGVTRLPAAAAITTLRFTFETALTSPLLIPKGTKVMSKDNKVIFATSEDVNAGTGIAYIDVPASCTEAGESGNGYLAGDINQLIDPLPYVQTVENITLTYGGADIESDDHLRMRIQIAPESFSTAGPEGAYEYWAKTAHQDIVDVAVWSPEPGKVKVVPLLKGGGIPDADMLAIVKNILNSEKRRVLTDQVIVEAPVVVNYSIDVQLYIYTSFSMLSDVILAKANDNLQSYRDSVKEHLGVDIVPEQIVEILQKITGVYRAVVSQPVYTTLARNEVAICTGITITIAGSVDG
ncbi:baseplate assembly protein [Dissulfurispira sp.]|uniref:baseplate assembly protein n=1 Tax=Dissulfurispira sp. TaxID=2817609 RepID=UPI002FDB24EE